jgi:hypothetical protein
MPPTVKLHTKNQSNMGSMASVDPQFTMGGIGQIPEFSS